MARPGLMRRITHLERLLMGSSGYNVHVTRQPTRVNSHVINRHLAWKRAHEFELETIERRTARLTPTLKAVE